MTVVHQNVCTMTDNSLFLPRLAHDLAPIHGRLRVELDDFRVEEVPVYEPCGEGDHLFVHFRKRGLTTPEAVKRLAQALEVDGRDAGWAGMKDRHGVTTQWVSFLGGDPERARAASVEGLEVLEAAAHRHKLRTGHLKANRFVLRLRDAGDELEQARRILAVLERAGVPNYFGEQRFGRDGANVARARRWLLEGGRAPKKRFEKRLLVSALQSSLFNEVLADRLRDGLFEEAVEGDLMRKEDSGGLFTTEDAQEAARRMAAWEISPTGPMPGPKMRWPEARARTREEAVLERRGMTAEHLKRFGKLGEGTRRALRVPLRDLTAERDGPDLVLSFELPPGSYATVVTRELLGD